MCFFKQKTAYEMRISDWSSDVCSSDLSAAEKDFEPIIEDIERQNPDVIFSTVVGASTTDFYRAYAKAGFKPEIMPIASVNTNEKIGRESCWERVCKDV